MAAGSRAPRCVGCGRTGRVDPTCGRCPACKRAVQVEAAGRVGRPRRRRAVWAGWLR